MTLRKGFPAELAFPHSDDMRYNMAGLYVNHGNPSNTTTSPRAGVLFPTGAQPLARTSSMNVIVTPFKGVAIRDGGVVQLSNDGNVNVPISASPSSNSRIDVIYAKQNDSSSYVAAPDVNDNAVFGVLQGTAAPAPVRNPAALPDGALELGEIVIPATAVTTQSAGVIIRRGKARNTAASGGTVYCQTQAEMDEVVWTAGQHIWVEENTSEWVITNGQEALALVRPAGLQLLSPGGVSGSGVSIDSGGNVVFTNVSVLNISGLFTSEYSDYLLKIDIYSSIAETDVRGRWITNGVVNTNLVHRNFTKIWDHDSESRAGNHTVNSMFVAHTSGAGGGATEVWVSGVSRAGEKMVRSSMMHSGGVWENGAWSASAVGTPDGIALNTVFGTMTGIIRAYGYFKGGDVSIG